MSAENLYFSKRETTRLRLRHRALQTLSTNKVDLHHNEEVCPNGPNLLWFQNSRCPWCDVSSPSFHHSKLTSELPPPPSSSSWWKKCPQQTLGVIHSLLACSRWPLVPAACSASAPPSCASLLRLSGSRTTGITRSSRRKSSSIHL